MQDILEIIKDYGAAIISTLSVGGIAAIAGVIVKVKKAISDTKEAMSSVIKKKDESEKQLQNKYEETLSVIKQQNEKIDTLTSEINKIKKK